MSRAQRKAKTPRDLPDSPWLRPIVTGRAPSGAMLRPIAGFRASRPELPLPDPSAGMRRWNTLRLTGPQAESAARSIQKGAARPPKIRLSDDQIAALARTAMPLLPMWLNRAGAVVWLRAKDARDDKDAVRDLVDGITVLVAMPSDSRYVGAAAIAAETGLTTRRVARLLHTLALLTLVEYDPGSDMYRVQRWH